ncbi:MAG: TIR domain-containing protein, partial [Anaerolineae bacterium]|nr:TIR domain-containing protein [Anaerolineae bacterium]
MLMKLFISYSSDDRAWIIELCDALREDSGYLTWYDHLTTAASDWWRVIMENLETADVVIYVMTPRSIESIYCQTEIAYALALNKPVLPICLKDCEYPKNLDDKRLQRLDLVANPKVERALGKIERSLGQIRLDQRDGHYQATPAPRPAAPKKRVDPQEAYTLGTQAAQEANFSLALSFYQQVIHAGESFYSELARSRYQEVEDYAAIQGFVDKGLLRDARALWGKYSAKHGTEYDPKRLVEALNGGVKPPVMDATAYFERAKQRYGEKDYHGAIVDYTEAIRIRPDDADAYNNRGLARNDLKDYTGAIAD